MNIKFYWKTPPPHPPNKFNFLITFHLAHKSLSPSTLLTNLAPCSGGFEYIGLITILTWLITFSATSLLLQTICKAPILSPYNPKFLAKLWDTNICIPSSRNVLIEMTSFSKSPLAYPWYAESKNGTNFLSFIRTANSFHCWGVGSTPVGLCAQTCSRTTDPALAWPMLPISFSQQMPIELEFF